MTTKSKNAQKVIKRIKEDPDFFYNEILGTPLWDKQREIDEKIWNNRRVSVRSCNGAGKTFFIPRLALRYLITHKNAIVINTAPTWRQIEGQYWKHFRQAWQDAKVYIGGELYKTQFNYKEDWFAMGVASNVQNVANFQGWHGDNVLVIFDEASGIPPIIWEAVEGLISGGANSKLVAIGNPNSNSGPFYDTFTDPEYKQVHISAFDIPNVKEGREVIRGLSNKGWVEEMRRKYGEDSDIWRVRVLGEPPLAESDSLVPLNLITDAIGADREEYGTDEIIGLDVARFGNDKSAFVYRKGNKAEILEVIDKNNTMELAGRAKQYLNKYKNAKIYIDIIGNGAGVYDRLKEQPDVASRVYGVASSGKPNSSDYINIRAESWSNIKEWLRDAILIPNDDWLQIAKPKYKITSNGKIQLESKEDMKKKGVSSPDVGDALALTLSRPTEGGNQGIVWV